jgi:hypothetical protein
MFSKTCWDALKTQHLLQRSCRPTLYNNFHRRYGFKTTIFLPSRQKLYLSFDIASLKKRLSKQSIVENSSGLQQPIINRQKSFPNNRNKQRTSMKPILNADDVNEDYFISKRNQKISVNHLLNFSFPERQSVQISKKSNTTYHPAFNKERFVNAK